MSKLIRYLSIVVLTGSYAIVGCCQANTAYAEGLKRMASNVRVISMYYTPYTDATFESNEVMKRYAKYSVRINCFMNCDMYMSHIIYHLSHAVSIPCPSMQGSRYLLIEFDDDRGNHTYINYLKWGNAIVLAGGCYYNKVSIDEVFPAPTAIDKLLQPKGQKAKMNKGGEGN